MVSSQELLTKEEYIGHLSLCLDYDNRLWPDFLIIDCKEFIANLHTYRMKHLLDNIQEFIDYIDTLTQEYTDLLSDETFAPQAQATIQALFLLSCVEFTSASKERMMIREMLKEKVL